MEQTQQLFSLSAQLKLARNSRPLQAPVTTVARSKAQQEHLKALHHRNFENGVKRYRAVLSGKGWLSTFDVECKLGCMPTAANAFLRKLVKLKYIQRRPRGNTEKYLKNRGWEFQWIDGQ